MSLIRAFEITDDLTVWDAWLLTINLLSILHKKKRDGEDPSCKSEDIYKSIYTVYRIAEKHSIDQYKACSCGLSSAEHALLKRKILGFYKVQVSNLRRIII